MRSIVKSKLEEVRSKIRVSAAQTDSRFHMSAILRCLDNHQLIIASISRSESPHDNAIENIGMWDNWGLNESLSLFWSESVKSEGIPMFFLNQKHIAWAQSILRETGKIRYIEHILDLERVGLVKFINYINETLICEYTPDAIGVEKIEREELSFISKRYEQLVTTPILKNLEAKRNPVLKRMQKLVDRKDRFSIRYGAHPEVDNHFSKLAEAIAATKLGWDAFPQDTNFGGRPFYEYLACIQTLIGFALKHQAFCNILWNRHREIDPINILTIPCHWKTAIQNVAAALECPEHVSEQLMEFTVINDNNRCHHFGLTSGPLAPHYAISSDAVMRLISGCLDQPFLFLLRELRRRHSPDWDKSVDNREQMFRDQLIQEFSRFPNIAFYSENINITSAKGKTDIDAIAVDFSKGVAALFQLKWQDYFGYSIRERESRKSNFIKAANDWTEKVVHWVEEKRIWTSLISIGLSENQIKKINSVEIFVIGRSFSHFSGDCYQDQRAAWGSWPQLCRVLEERVHGDSPLQSVAIELRRDSPLLRAPKLPASHSVKISNLKVIVFANETERRSAEREQQ